MRLVGKEIELDVIYNEDCVSGLCRIPDESVDLILTDPPYGTIKGLEISGADRSWDVVVDMEKLFEEYFRVLKPKGRVVIFSANQFTQTVRSLSNSSLDYVYPLVWYKRRISNPLSVNKAPAQVFEDISVFHKKTEGLMPMSRDYSRKVQDFIDKGVTKIAKELGHNKASSFFSPNAQVMFGKITEDVYNQLIERYEIDKMVGFLTYEEYLNMYNSERVKDSVYNLPEGRKAVTNVFEVPIETGRRYHITQKPIDLLTQLIELYTNEGDLVLDTFMGGGSTAIACIDTKRRYIGYELNERFYDIAINRIEEHADVKDGERLADIV